MYNICVQVAQSCIEYCLKGSSSKECIVKSFLSTLADDEKLTLLKAMKGEFCADDVIDVLTDYNVQTFPRKSNVVSIIENVAQMEMINKPMAILNKIREGASKFWEDITFDEIDAMYSLSQATSENILNALFHRAGGDRKDAQVYRWLLRYVKNLDRQSSMKFVRFCTAGDVLLPRKKIKVQFENVSEARLRPRSRTCFNILVLPKNYATYNQLYNNLNIFIKDTSQWDLND